MNLGSKLVGILCLTFPVLLIGEPYINYHTIRTDMWFEAIGIDRCNKYHIRRFGGFTDLHYYDTDGDGRIDIVKRVGAFGAKMPMVLIVQTYTREQNPELFSIADSDYDYVLSLNSSR